MAMGSGSLPTFFATMVQSTAGPVMAMTKLRSVCESQWPPKSPAWMTPVTDWPSGMFCVATSWLWSARMSPCMACLSLVGSAELCQLAGRVMVLPCHLVITDLPSGESGPTMRLG